MWKKVEGFEDYLVNENGEVFSTQSNKYLVPLNNGIGYYGVTLWKNGVGVRKLIHRLVAIAFLPCEYTYDSMQVHHKDSNPANNSLANLEWVDAQTNIDYKLGEVVYIYHRYSGLVGRGTSVTGAGRSIGLNQSQAMRSYCDKISIKDYIITSYPIDNWETYPSKYQVYDNNTSDLLFFDTKREAEEYTKIYGNTFSKAVNNVYHSKNGMFILDKTRDIKKLMLKLREKSYPGLDLR